MSCKVWETNPYRGIHHHITVNSRMEAFKQAIGETSFTPHLDYYKSHTTRTITIPKRGFDSSLHIKS